MKKLEPAHMEAIGTIVNAKTLKQLLKLVKELSSELPNEFDQFKDHFKHSDILFDRAASVIADKCIKET